MKARSIPTRGLLVGLALSAALTHACAQSAVAPWVGGKAVGPGNPLPSAPKYGYTPVPTHQQLTVTSGAVVTLTPPAGATMASFTIETASIRMLDDGASPTTTLGNVWQVGPAYYAGDLTKLKFIAPGTTATLDVLYYTQ